MVVKKVKATSAKSAKNKAKSKNLIALRAKPVSYAVTLRKKKKGGGKKKKKGGRKKKGKK